MRGGRGRVPRRDLEPSHDAIWEALPIEGRANRWGDEIYFRVGLDMPEEDAREVVEVGDLGYWPPGQAFCLFFGRIEGDAARFRGVRDGAPETSHTNG